MEAKFKVGDRVRLKTERLIGYYQMIGRSDYKVGGVMQIGSGIKLKLVDENELPVSADRSYDYHSYLQDDFELVESAKSSTPTITIGSTWYWQGEKDSPVTVIGFDSKGRIVFEYGFDDDLSGHDKGEIIPYLSDEKEFTTRYKNVPNKPKPKKLTGYVRVLKSAEGYLLSKETGDHIFQSAVFSDEAKARAAVPYGFEVVDVVKVEWSEEAE